MTIKDLNKELAQEVSREDADIEKITKLLEEGARANTYTNGQPLLHAACKAGNPQVVSLLLEKGASPNARGFQGTTPLYIASQNGHAEVVKELLKRDADMKYAKQAGATAKWVAKKEGHKDVLEILEEEEKKRLEEDEKRKITSPATEAKEAPPAQLEEHNGRGTPSSAIGPRQGTLYCGCCCDMRRAVISVNIVSIIFNAVFAFLALASNSGTDEYGNKIELTGEQMAIIIGLTLGAVFFALSGIFGAIRFNIWALLITLLWYIADLIISLVLLNFIRTGVVVLVYLYPHAALIQQITQGIMSRETYPREASCCV